MKLMEKEFANLRDDIYPLMMDMVHIQEKGQGQMVNGALAEGLWVTYCIDLSEEKIRYITYQDLRDWGISHTTLHVTAVHNLERLTDGKRITKLDAAQGGRPIFVWHVEDGFDAARILLVKWLEEFATTLPVGDLLIGVPHRNWMVAFSDEDPELVKVVRRRVSQEHHSAEFPVSPFVYRWTDQGLERYKG